MLKEMNVRLQVMMMTNIFIFACQKIQRTHLNFLNTYHSAVNEVRQSC